MSNFFRNAPSTQDTEQKRFVEAISQKQHVIVSAPLNYAWVSLYSLPAMLSAGLVIVVCPGVAQIRQYLEYFRGAGLQFPDIAVLDGTQMPHEERAVKAEINLNRVRLLYTTPERFISLTFLEILVHSPIRFLVIDEAERFFPGQPGHAPYNRLLKEGLQQLSQLPSMVLLLPALPPARFEEIAHRLSLKPFQVISQSPDFQAVRLKVKTLLTEHQKIQVLLQKLAGNPGLGKVGRVDEPGNVLIQAVYPAQAEKLAATLIDYGFECVEVTHSKKSAHIQKKVLQHANTKQHIITVNGGSDLRLWSPPSEAKASLYFWNPPSSLQSLLNESVRQPLGNFMAQPPYKPLQMHILYTKEDYLSALQRLQRNPYLDPIEIKAKTQALQQVRNWILSNQCRIQSLKAFYLGGNVPTALSSPCGDCDNCRRNHAPQGVIAKAKFFYRRWLY